MGYPAEHHDSGNSALSLGAVINRDYHIVQLGTVPHFSTAQFFAPVVCKSVQQRVLDWCLSDQPLGADTKHDYRHRAGNERRLRHVAR